MKKTFEISADDAGSTALKFIKRHFPNLPLSAIHKIFRKRDFKKNGTRIGEKEVLEKGDEISIFLSKKTEEKPQKKQCIPSGIFEKEIEILWEDEDFLVLNKHEGMPAHSGSGTKFGLIDVVQTRWKTAHLAHRLDRDTSGVILLAKNGEVLRKILPTMKQWTKEYMALVFGKFVEKSGTIRIPLESRENPKKKQIAITHFAVEKEFEETTLLKVQLETGRTHQIRRHFAALGKPLVGDTKYGDFSKNREFGTKRLFLHAMRLEFPHPITGKKIQIENPPPNVFFMPIRERGITRNKNSFRLL